MKTVHFMLLPLTLSLFPLNRHWKPLHSLVMKNFKIQVIFCFRYLLVFCNTTQQDFSSEITYVYLSIPWIDEIESAIRISLARLVFLKSNVHVFTSIVIHRYYISIWTCVFCFNYLDFNNFTHFNSSKSNSNHASCLYKSSW